MSWYVTTINTLYPRLVIQSNKVPQLGVAGFWSLINVILIVSKHPIHPGFHIALDIVLTFALWLFGFLGLHASTGGTWTGTSHYGAITASAFMTVDG